MKILILRFSSIGDIVLTTPVIRCLRNKYPEAEIHYATKKGFQSILANNPYLNKIHLLNDSIWDLINELRQEKFDYVIDLHHNQRTLLIKTMLGAKSSSFNKLNYEKWLMVNFKINHLPNQHIVDRYLDTCKALNVENDGQGLDYFISNEEMVAPGHQQYIAWVIGAKQNTKKFPVGKIIGVLNSPDFPALPVMLLGGKEDLPEAEQIGKAVSRTAPLINACGKYSLNQSASLVKQASLVISNDTGLMHIAAAFKKPVVSVWGNTIPQFGMYPYYGNLNIANAIMEVNGLNCRPCSKLGYGACPQGHFKCMNLQDEQLLIQQVKRLMA